MFKLAIEVCFGNHFGLIHPTPLVPRFDQICMLFWDTRYGIKNSCPLHGKGLQDRLRDFSFIVMAIYLLSSSQVNLVTIFISFLQVNVKEVEFNMSDPAKTFFSCYPLLIDLSY